MMREGRSNGPCLAACSWWFFVLEALLRRHRRHPAVVPVEAAVAWAAWEALGLQEAEAAQEALGLPNNPRRRHRPRVIRSDPSGGG